jgi:outer membrane protein OmpA-like peptidoglycan-associated protein
MLSSKLRPGSTAKTDALKGRGRGRASRPVGWMIYTIAGIATLAGILAYSGSMDTLLVTARAATSQMPRMPVPRWLPTTAQSETADLAAADEQTSASAALRARLIAAEREVAQLRPRVTELDRQMRALELAASRDLAAAKEREARLEAQLQLARNAPTPAVVAPMPPAQLETAAKPPATTPPVTIMAATVSPDTSRACEHVNAEPQMALVLQFKSSNGGVQTDHHAALADMVAEVNGCPSLALDIKGFSDNQGPEPLNAALSKQRAQQTAQFLLAQGVRADRMTIVGMADRDPVATNATPEGRARNRRVEVRVYQVADRQQQPASARALGQRRPTSRSQAQ